MHDEVSRSDRNIQQIQLFLGSSASSMPMMLYGREIHKLAEKFPNICIKKGNSDSKNEKLYKCTITKK